MTDTQKKTTVEKRTGMAVSAHKRTFCHFVQ